MIKIGLSIVVIFFATTTQAPALNCGSATKELAKLRNQYRLQAGVSSNERRSSFDDLMKILDKIVALKEEMRKSNCKIPPRN